MVLIALDEDSSARRAAWLLRRSGGAPGLNLRAGSASALAAIRAFDESWDGSLPATYLISAEGQLLVAQRGITELDALLSEMDRTAPATSRSKEGRRPR